MAFEDIDLIVAHGAATKKGDAAENKAIAALFGDKKPPVVYHKWLLGHSLGAAAAMSFVLACQHLKTQKFDTTSLLKLYR